MRELIARGSRREMSRMVVLIKMRGRESQAMRTVRTKTCESILPILGTGGGESVGGQGRIEVLRSGGTTNW